jgi:nucleotidyltransferase substrate binding protein (TIGR01987 family)
MSIDPEEDKMSNQNIIAEIKNIILKYSKPDRIYLYGSRASGEASETSDIDIAYNDPEFKQNYLIEEEVAKIPTLLKIDVQNIAKADERFKNRVLSTGKVLYSASKKLRAEDALYNYERAYERFAQVVEREKQYKEDGYGDVYLDLIIKRFEFTYEMSWKTIKRLLSFLGIEVKSPRETFKEAYAQGIIADEAIWLDMIEQRNLSSHVYDEYEVSEILEKKERYKEAFERLKTKIESLLNQSSGG